MFPSMFRIDICILLNEISLFNTNAIYNEKIKQNHFNL